MDLTRFEAGDSKYKVVITHYNGFGLSTIQCILTMGYDDWKKTFSENLERYDKEKKEQEAQWEMN